VQGEEYDLNQSERCKKRKVPGIDVLGGEKKRRLNRKVYQSRGEEKRVDFNSGKTY